MDGPIYNAHVLPEWIYQQGMVYYINLLTPQALRGRATGQREKLALSLSSLRTEDN